MNEERLLLMREIERRAARPVFDQEPYVKFVPLILYSPEFDWGNASTCNPDSRRLIVVPAFGRDPISRDGWLHLAAVAAYSLLHCRGIESWAIHLATGNGSSQYNDLQADALFGQNLPDLLNELYSRGVSIDRIPGLDSPASVYGFYLHRAELILCMDADSGLLPDALSAPCFSFAADVGHSGLNWRHTGRSGLEQLVHKDGRMSRWPESMMRERRDWVEAVARIGEQSLGVSSDVDSVIAHMEEVSWPSAGLSYIREDHLESLVTLRNEMVNRQLVPAWDEESVKLAHIGILDLDVETCRVPVLEHWEYDHSTPSNAVINFRNFRSQGPWIRALLDGNQRNTDALGMLRNFTADIGKRTRLGGNK
jgi:hypothetical protein